MFQPFELRVCDGAGRDVRLEVNGAVDMASAPQLLESVLIAASSSDHQMLVIVDLADCTFIDSSGVAALMAASLRVRDHRSHLVITNPPELIARILDMAGLYDCLDIRSGWATQSVYRDTAN